MCQPGSGCGTLCTFLCVNQNKVVATSAPFFLLTRIRLWHSGYFFVSSRIRLWHTLDLSLCQPGSGCGTLCTFLCVNQDQVVTLPGPFFVSTRIRLWHSLDISLCQPGSGCGILWTFLRVNQDQVVSLSGPSFVLTRIRLWHSGYFFVSSRIRLWHSLDLSLYQPGTPVRN